MQLHIIKGTCILGCLFFVRPQPPLQFVLVPFFPFGTATEVVPDSSELHIESLPFETQLRAADPKHLPGPWQQPEALASRPFEGFDSLWVNGPLDTASVWQFMAYQERSWHSFHPSISSNSHVARVPKHKLLTTPLEMMELLGGDVEDCVLQTTDCMPDRYSPLNGKWHWYKSRDDVLVLRWFVGYPHGSQTSFQLDRWFVFLAEP